MAKKITEYLNTLIEIKKIKVADLTAILNISKDAVYRKLRGETDFLFNEVLLLQAGIGFALEEFVLQPNTNKISLDIKRFTNHATPADTVGTYISQLVADFTQLSSIGKPHMLYAAKDLPLFCFFSSPVLTSFKLYFWEKTLFSTNKPTKYNAHWLPNETLVNASILYTMYENIDSTEIWNQETLKSTLDQIQYCWESGLIDRTDAQDILQALTTFIDTLDEYAAEETKKNGTSFKLYFNKILILDNSVLFKIGDIRMYYLPFCTINFFTSTQPQFTLEMENWIHNQIKKSTLISGEAQKERTIFIRNYKKLIEHVEKNLVQSTN